MEQLAHSQVVEVKRVSELFSGRNLDVSIVNRDRGVFS